MFEVYVCVSLLTLHHFSFLLDEVAQCTQTLIKGRWWVGWLYLLIVAISKMT